MKARAYWATGPGEGKILEEEVDHGRFTMLWSGISRGTETLIARGNVPESQWQQMRCPNQQGDFPFPVKYGYQAVASDGQQNVFALFPHQDCFDLEDDAVVPLPANLPPRRAILAANMETALNALWDSAAGPGDRINVVGAGVVGALIAYICARIPGTDVTLSDMLPERQTLAEQFNCRFETTPIPDADIAFHASATSAGMQAALNSLGLEGKLIELSWFGTNTTGLNLGASFHSKRLNIISSQVGMVAPSRRPRWNYRRRIEKALELLCDPVLNVLIDGEIAFEDLPEHMTALANGNSPGLCTAVRYQQ